MPQLQLNLTDEQMADLLQKLGQSATAVLVTESKVAPPIKKPRSKAATARTPLARRPPKRAGRRQATFQVEEDYFAALVLLHAELVKADPKVSLSDAANLVFAAALSSDGDYLHLR